MTIKIVQGDALAVLKQIKSDCIQTCVTSPPYWGLRDYNTPGQIMSTPANTYWTDSRVTEIRAYCEQNLSYHQIAARMGGGITANAVIGKAGRLGISNGRHQPPKQQTLQNIKKWRPKQKQKAKSPSLPPAPPPLPFVLAPEIPAPLEQRKTIHDLENNHCRWPYGEPAHPGFYFCGAPTANLAEGVPYCPAHFRVAYRQR